MKSGNKTETKKKDLKKSDGKEKTSQRTNKVLRKGAKVDTDFHHVHPFKEN